MLKKLLIFTGIIVGFFLLINYVLMPLYVKHSDTVITPKVIGSNYIEAKKIIEDAGLEIIQGDIKYDENIQIGMILDQNPPPDATVKYGRRIYVTISGGEQLSEVPNLKGKSLRDAKFTLEQRGLKLGETVRKPTQEFPEDVVISQIIQPGSKVKRNTKLDLILSDGPQIGDLKVPSLVGKSLEEAKKIITDSKLKIGKITYQTNNNVPAGQIVDQYPKQDKSANENTAVDIFVARKKVIEQTEILEDDPDGNANVKDSDEGNDPDVMKEKPLIKKDDGADKSDKPSVTKPDKEKDDKVKKETPKTDNPGKKNDNNADDSDPN
ncbi:MAG TPA: PASTA domain-containing protein [Ignavibacteria bacterium]|nr:PASTA domain-containing protein [Ignavibacteria bacterium]HRJ98040.1 PASTA domain-containing protein [Ignavibacteria bacterium]